MFTSIRRTLISATIVLLMVGGSVAAATGFDDFPLASLAPSLSDDSPSSTTSTLPGADDNSNSSSTTSTSSTTTSTTSTLPGADDNSNSSSTTSTSSTTTSTTSTLPGADDTLGESTTHQVAEVGTVSIAEGGGLLHVTDATSIDGWSIYVERADSIEVEVSFRSADGRVDFKAELEHGEVRIRVRDRRLESSGGGSGSGSSSNSDDSGSSSNSDNSQSESTLDEVRTVEGTGGTVTARATGSDIVLVTATPNDGWSMDINNAGPGRVEVRFEKGSAENRIRLEVRNGMLAVDLEDRP